MRTLPFAALSLSLSACGSSSTDQVASAPIAPVSAPATSASAPAAVASAVASGSATPVAPQADIKKIALPGAGADGVSTDFLVFEPTTASVWIPAGNTGSVDVIDTATAKVTRIDGFATKDVEREGKKRTMGPSSASVGDGVVYIGNRADSAICIVDIKTLTKTKCGPKLDSSPDGVVYVAPTKEVWVTTPKDKSIRILDGKTLAQKGKITVDGSPEGYAVDATRGRFYTNLEDGDQTLAIDLKTHKTISSWKAGCGKEGPRCLHMDEPNGLLFVACTTQLEAMDVAHDGAILGSVDTGEGVDDFDFAPSTRTLYVGAGKAGKLTVAHADEKGKLTITGAFPTAAGARNGVVDPAGNVYLAHGSAGEILMVTPPKK